MKHEQTSGPGRLRLKRRGAPDAADNKTTSKKKTDTSRREFDEFAEVEKPKQEVAGWLVPESDKAKSYISGTGRVVTIEDMLQGLETIFMDEVTVGDMIGVNHPQSMSFEERRVLKILSQRSLRLGSSFSSDLVSTTRFYIKKEGEKLQAIARSKVEDQLKDRTSSLSSRQESSKDKKETEIDNVVNEELTKLVESMAGGASKSALKLREKSGQWGYKTVTEKLDKEYTTEELLDMRIKRTGRDKYC